MKRPVKLPVQFERSTSLSDTLPVSARPRSTSDRDGRDRVNDRTSSSASTSPGEVVHPFMRARCSRRSSAPAYETIRGRSGAVCVTAFASSQFLTRARPSSLTTCRSMSMPLASLPPCLDKPIELDPADNRFHRATSRTECESAGAPMRQSQYSAHVDARGPEPRSAARRRENPMIDRCARRLALTTLERRDAHCA